MSGKTILITRPKGDGEALSEALHELGLRVVHEPLTEIFLRHTALHEVDHALRNDPDAIILTSRHGANALAALSELRDPALLCVGEETARTAESLGFTRVSSAGGTVDKLLEFIAAAYDEKSRFLYLSADQVRVDIVPALQSQGMQATRIVVYEAAASEQLSEIVIEQLRRGALDAVTFFSQRSAQIFHDLLKKAGLGRATENMHAFALSDTVAVPLKQHSWQEIHIAKQPTLASLVECVDNSLRTA